jgi:integrase/recombinase XerC
MSIPPIQNNITTFLSFLQYEKRYSTNTIVSYTNDLNSFANFIATEFEVSIIKEISSSIVRSWLASLKENKLEAKSINRKISTLKSFFKYFIKTGQITSSPMAIIVSPKVGKRLPQFVEATHINTLLNHVEFTNDWQGNTEKLVIELFYNTGIRLNELIQLTENNIDQGYNQIKVLGKGGKERIIPISQKLIVDIKNYIANKPKEAVDNVFVTPKGKALNPRYIYGFVKKNLGTVTTISKKSPHILRHSFATHLMNNGAELNAVKELLGHSSLAATQIYTHNTIDKLKDVFAKAHPKA